MMLKHVDVYVCMYVALLAKYMHILNIWYTYTVTDKCSRTLHGVYE